MSATGTLQLLAELSGMPEKRRHFSLRNSARFRVPELCNELTRRSFAQRFNSRLEMEGLAIEAALLAQSLDSPLPAQGEVADTVAAAHANLANAYRMTGRFPQADAAFVLAYGAQARGTGSSELSDRLDSLVASLRIYQRRTPEAVGILAELARRRRDLGDISGQARAFIQTGTALTAAEEPLEARTYFLHALDCLRSVPDVALERLAVLGIVFCFVDLERAEEANALWDLGNPLFDDCDRILALRWEWQRGLIDSGLGRFPLAIARLSRTRDAFAETGLRFEAVLSALDLASTYLRAGGNLGTAAQALGEALGVLRSMDAPREVIATISGLRAVREQGAAQAVLTISRAAREFRRSIPA